MIVLTPPDNLDKYDHPSIFLAGAITDAPNWQAEAVELLYPSFVTFFNPRRQAGFVSSDHPDYLLLYEEQVKWEHKYLLEADIVLFWMPQGPLAITTRFELGWWFGMHFSSSGSTMLRPFAVGIEPGVFGDTYYRIVLPTLGIPVHTTLQAACEWASRLVDRG